MSFSFSNSDKPTSNAKKKSNYWTNAKINIIGIGGIQFWRSSIFQPFSAMHYTVCPWLKRFLRLEYCQLVLTDKQIYRFLYQQPQVTWPRIQYCVIFFWCVVYTSLPFKSYQDNHSIDRTQPRGLCVSITLENAESAQSPGVGILLVAGELSDRM